MDIPIVSFNLKNNFHLAISFFSEAHTPSHGALVLVPGMKVECPILSLHVSFVKEVSNILSGKMASHQCKHTHCSCNMYLQEYLWLHIATGAMRVLQYLSPFCHLIYWPSQRNCSEINSICYRKQGARVHECPQTKAS